MPLAPTLFKVNCSHVTKCLHVYTVKQSGRELVSDYAESTIRVYTYRMVLLYFLGGSRVALYFIIILLSLSLLLIIDQ